MPEVTRLELLEHVKAAFATGPATKRDLLDAALDSRARREVLVVLSQLPNARFVEAKELWDNLTDLPTGA